MLNDKPLRIHVIQHVPFEGPAAINDWVVKRGHQLTLTRLYRDEVLPAQEDFDWLVVMGGPMGVKDVALFPWLLDERRFILETIQSDKMVLGICLGAQLIASALGATVRANDEKEIGWFPIFPSPLAPSTSIASVFAESVDVFHWHADTFDIPPGAQTLVESQACVNQGFILDDRVVGLQFHLESTAESIAALIEHCSDELDDSRYVQTKDAMLDSASKISTINGLLFKLLDTLAD